jgi:hypothetical protein
VASTTNDRNYFEESFPWSPQLVGDDIYSETVPAAADPTAADNNVTSNPTILQKLTDFPMDEMPGSNGQGYSTYDTPGNTTTARLIDWLTPQKFGNGYAVSLKQQDDTPIALTDGAFQVDYRNGIVRFDPNFRPADLGYSLPLKLTAYRYIGDRISNGGASTLTVTEVDLSPSIPNVSELRFQNSTVTDLGSGIVEVDNSAAGGGGEVLVVQAFNVVGPAVTQFTLSQTPGDANKVFLIGNGLAYAKLAGHISVVGTLVTWLGVEFASFDPSDEVVITYTV